MGETVREDQLSAVNRLLQSRMVDDELKKREDPEFLGSGIVEPIRTVASGLNNTIRGGLAGIGAAMIPGGKTGAETVAEYQSQSFQPKTESGQANLQKIGDLVNMGIDVANMPISSLYGLAEFTSSMLGGQGLDKSLASQAKTQGQAQEDGFSKTVGNDVFEATGSPLLATAAQVLPEGMMELGGLKGAGPALKASKQAVGTSVAVVKDVGEVIAFNTQTPTRRKITQLLEDNSTDRETAGFRLTAPEGQEQTSSLPEFMRVGRQRATNDPFQREAINQGFDEGVIAAIRGASDSDRASMGVMLETMERGKKNSRYAAQNRPADVVGKSALERFNSVLAANKDAGKRLDAEAQKLKGNQLDVSGPVNEFLEDLDSMGISINDDLTPNFKGSDIEGLQAPEAAIKRLVSRMATNGPVDAFEMHRLKKFIDENVTFGKSGEGLSGKTENIMKNLRRNLDGALDSNFDSYNQVNTQYAETIGAIDNLQSASGSKVNLSGGNADKAMGTVLRRLMSNTQSRVNLMDSLSELDTVAAKYGAKFDDDLLTQILFADELDRNFGPVARTGFQGQIAQALTRSKMENARVGVEKTVEALQGVNQEGGFKAMRELLNSF